MTSAARILEIARSQLGVVEGPGRDEVVYNTWFYGRRVSGDYPWCATFVSWVAHRAGATDIIPRTASTVHGADWFRARGRWGRTPRVGAVVYFAWPGMGRISHVGIVESIRSDGSIVSIEGNTDRSGSRTGRRVMRQVRRRWIAGYGYPNYGSAAAPPAPPAGKLLVDGVMGSATVKRLQQSLNRTGARPTLSLDGQFGRGTKRALQARLNHTNGPVDADGVIGPQTVRALQRNLRIATDGRWGSQTTRALQTALNHREL